MKKTTKEQLDALQVEIDHHRNEIERMTTHGAYSEDASYHRQALRRALKQKQILEGQL